MAMPVMSGMELEKKLKSICPELKCLFMSGHIGAHIAHHGILDENINFIQKPFTTKKLAAKVREVLDNK
jgi:FixJ family two-component response regulator